MMVTGKVTMKAGMTVKDLASVLDSTPDNATVVVKGHTGDRFSPDWYTLEFSWETE